MRLVAIGFAYTGENVARGAREIEHVAIGNGAFGESDIEGKAAMGSGERGGEENEF